MRHALMNINEACRWMREAADGSEVKEPNDLQLRAEGDRVRQVTVRQVAVRQIFALHPVHTACLFLLELLILLEAQKPRVNYVQWNLC